MNIAHTEYKPDRRQRPEALALLVMTMTLSSPMTANATSISSYATRHTIGHFDASGIDSVGNAMKLLVTEQRKRSIKRRIFEQIGVRLCDDLLLLPYRTADFLAELEIEPDYILPTEENGLSIEFRRDGIYHLIEFIPTGEIVFLKKVGKHIETWDLVVDNYFDILQSELV